ncbi:S1 family peptidase [Pseudarthrobacter sp. R1]|uniref:S1 family peptidase n=1 Tax=Pseudarthrobacter sp. R1 TaxID=2944934 RepID=UPI00210E93C6|nr:S1 family peptidase [Pseudarthrobacter sp. R1]MCQ6273178.1 S1 family peptidase [Pseudarthrobacter sp. R1]
MSADNLRSAGNLRRFLASGAAAGVLASSAFAVSPVWAADATELPEPPAAVTDAQHSGLSAAALEEAVLRDLGMTPEEFAAAGERGIEAAGVANRLRDVPGYSGIRLQDGQILVSGSGAELLAEVAVLAQTVPALAVEDAAGPVAAEARVDDNAPSPGSELAVSTEQLFQAYIREVGTEGLQAVVASGGKFVIRTGGVNSPEAGSDAVEGGTAESGSAPGGPTAATAPVGSGKKSPSEFVARFANVELDGGAPLAPEADVPGGVGYIADTGWFCSTGFSAFDPAGLPAVLTAGHCASDGAAQTADLESQFNRLGLLGRFGFSQFGGTGNSWVLDPNTAIGPDNTAVTDPGNVGTDIAVIESLRPDLDPLPATSTWGDTSEPEPNVKIIGTTDPVAGMPVCRSGRTSAWSCGKVDAVGIFIVPGPTYVEPTETSDPGEPLDLRAVRGFMSYGVQSSGGDSGGPYVSGNYAVGTHAAGDTPDEFGNVIQNFAVGATLTDGLSVLPGYQLELFLNKPVVASPAPGAVYEAGQAISGSVPAAPATAIAAGSKVRIRVEGKELFEVPVNADGTWAFPAPEGNGPLRFTAETVNGFSVSGTSSFEFTAPAASAEPSAAADPAPLARPASADGPPAVVVTPPVRTPPAGLANTGGNADRRDTGNLAYTGPSALLPAAGAAATAIAVGAVLMALVRRRRTQTPEKRF